MTCYFSKLMVVSFLLIQAGLHAQIFCPDTEYYSPPDSAGVIHWTAYPEFHLPAQFKLVYEGPRLADELMQPIQHGFSHIANQFDNIGVGDYDNLPVQNRALTWYHVASCLNGQTWYYPCYSPWGNDTAAYKNEWANRLGYYADLYTDTYGDSLPHVDLLVADIEASRLNGFNDNADYIDSLFYHPEDCDIPASYLDGTVDEFETQYQKDMMKLYTVPMRFVEQALDENGYNTQLSAYGEGPVATTYHKINHYTWDEWITDESLVSYLVKDSMNNLIDDAPFYSNCDFISPNSYYIYDDDPYYLAYSLFQVEVNKAWSDKDLVLYVALRYNNGEYITPTMAEATAIMPIMSGANGLWLWDHYYPGEADTAHLKNYDYFIRGLYRLSEYSNYFIGDYSIIIPETAHALFLSGQPTWRAVVNGNGILIAAQNPFAADEEITNLAVNYQGWSQEIALTGKQVFLCDFIWNPDGVESINAMPSVSVFPNPMNQAVTFSMTEGDNYTLEIKNALSQKVFGCKLNKTHKIDTSSWTSGLYTYQIYNKDGQLSGKLVKL